MSDALLVGGAITGGIFLLFPRTWLPRLAGYQTITDIVASSYVVSTYAAAGAASGLTGAVFGAIGISLTLRLLGGVFGTERYHIRGRDSPLDLVAALVTHGVAWLRQIGIALVKGTSIKPPEPLQGEWVRTPGWFG